MNFDKETQWIELVKEYDDSIALESLVRRYRPMIDNMYIKFFIDSYDKSDWYQEAFIVCYQTCCLFDAQNGSKFGSFFKMKFQNHIIDIIRRENAVKRRANIRTESYDNLVINGTIDDLTTENDNWLEVSNQIERILVEMSSLELLAFQFLLGKISLKDACESAQCDVKQIMRAVGRCKNKIKKSK